MLRAFSLVLGARVVSAALQALFVALLTRSIGVTDFGVYTAISSLCFLFLSATDFGFSQRILRIGADEDGRGVLSTVGLTYATACALMVLVAFLIAGATADGGRYLLIVVSVIWVAGESMGDIAVSALLGIQQRRWSSGILIARRALAVVPFVFGLTSETSRWALAASGIVGVAAGVIVVIVVGARPVSFLGLVRRSFRFWISATSLNLLRFDAVLLALTAPLSVVGFYGAAVRLYSPLNLVTSALLQVLVPALAHTKDVADRALRFRSTRRVVILASIVLALGSVLSPVLTNVLFGPSFAPAWPIVAAVIIGAALSAVSQVHLSWFFSAEIPRTVAWGLMVASLVQLALIATIPALFGTVGAALCVIELQASILFVILNGWRRHRPLDAAPAAAYDGAS